MLIGPPPQMIVANSVWVNYVDSENEIGSQKIAGGSKRRTQKDVGSNLMSLEDFYHGNSI